MKIPECLHVKVDRTAATVSRNPLVGCIDHSKSADQGRSFHMHGARPEMAIKGGLRHHVRIQARRRNASAVIELRSISARWQDDRRSDELVRTFKRNSRSPVTVPMPHHTDLRAARPGQSQKIVGIRRDAERQIRRHAGNACSIRREHTPGLPAEHFPAAGLDVHEILPQTKGVAVAGYEPVSRLSAKKVSFDVTHQIRFAVPA